MKILTITAHHPPCHFGGYEIRVKDIMDGLAARGHSIRVLTNYPEKTPHGKDIPQAYPVIRKLHNRRKARFFPKEILFDLADTRLLQHQIDQFKPDVIYLAHTQIFSKAIIPFLARQTIPIVYDEGGTSVITAWTEHGRWFRFTGDYKSRFAILNAIKPLVIRMVCAASRERIAPLWTWPENMLPFFNSELNYINAVQKGVPLNEPSVIHSGIDTDKFTFKPRKKMNSPLRILVPGRIERRKGQKDAVELLDHLIKQGIESRLVLAGSKWMDGYNEEVVNTIQTCKVEKRVYFLSMLTTEGLIDEYHKADICFFPSYFRTGFSRVPLEAMACGCVVISYGNEGSDEVIIDGENGFLVEKRAYTQIMRIIKILATDYQDVERITESARKKIEEEITIDRYIDKIEREIIALFNR